MVAPGVDPSAHHLELAKLVATAITGFVASAAAFRRDVTSLLNRKSLISEIEQEQKRITEIDKLQRQFNNDGEADAEFSNVLENDAKVARDRLKRLTRDFALQRQDPNYDLSFVQRLFLLFRPESKRAELIHWFSHAFMLLGLIAILYSAVLLPKGNESISEYREYMADLILAGCFGALVFRGWALAERRASHQHKCNSSLAKTLFFLRRPVNGEMFAAQACFWICSFWIVESIEDFIGDLNAYITQNHHIPWLENSLKFVAPLVAAVVCRMWAPAVYKREASATRRWWLATFLQSGWKTLLVLAAMAAFAGSLVIAVSQKIFDDRLHSVAFVVECLILLVACNQWLALRAAKSGAQKPLAAKAQASAA